MVYFPDVIEMHMCCQIVLIVVEVHKGHEK